MELLDAPEDAAAPSAGEMRETYLSDTERRDPQLLREAHPLLASVPPVADEEEARALRVDIRERGFDYPMLIDEHNRILDGRRRLRAALELGLKEIPVVVRPEYEAAGIILGGIALRRSLTKSAVHFLAYPLLEPALEAALERKLACLKKGDAPVVHSVNYGKTVAEIGGVYGLTKVMLYYAQSIHKALVDHPEWRSDVEQSILVEEKGLGGVYSGLQAKLRNGETNGEHRGDQLQLFTKWLDTAARRFEKWEALPPADRRAVLDKVPDHIAKMPPDLQAAYKKAILAAEIAELNAKKEKLGKERS